MAKKLGIYVCNGCGIGGCLDTKKLVDLAESEHQAAIVRTSRAFCLEDASLIRDDIEKEGVDSVVIAACSPRVNTDVFSFGPAFIERVNIREQVAWSHASQDLETQSLAEDYLRMGIVRAQKSSSTQPYTEANERSILVVGGGTAGMNSAIQAAKAGFKVLLVERSPQLGGFAARLHRQFPKRPPYREPEAPDIESKIRELQGLPGVSVLTSTEVAKIDGQPGRFSVALRRVGDAEAPGRGDAEMGVHGYAAHPEPPTYNLQPFTVGAMVLAIGWTPARSEALEAYGLGRYANVVTNVTLEEMAARGQIVRPSDTGPVRSAAIFLCDGPTDEADLPYAGNVSSLVALKQALYIRERQPDSIVYLFYEDMQTPGQYEYFYRRVQEDPRVLLSRGQIQRVSEESGGGLALEVDNTLMGGSIRLKVDLLVLSTGMIPATLDSGALNLGYLQGRDLPINTFGYADSHFICFPYETRRTGIYSAGAVRQPMDLAASARDGTAAALKAIQSIEKSSAGAAVHPRVGDLSFPNFFMQNCTSCGRCTQECPFGALELDDKKHPVLSPNRCRRCGICMGACPVQIISFADYSVDMLSSMIKAVDIPEGDDGKPRILALACENDAYPALDMAGISRLQYSSSVRVIPVRCLGSVNSILIADAVSRGFDGVALLGCKPGEDYQCHFIRGSELLEKRMDNVRETLDRLFLEAERVRFMEVAISESDRIPGLFAEFEEVIKKVGPNPMKGF